MDTEELPTCGRGVAAQSVLPAKLGETMASVADVLEAHLPALDPHDPDTEPERDAYRTLVSEHRDIAARLQALADRMAGYSVLPMGRHDIEVLSDVTAVEAFARLVRAKQELLRLLQETAAEDHEMLEEMRGDGS